MRAVLHDIPLLSSEDHCVDVGTGHGGLASYYARQGAWTYIDRDQANLSVAQTILRGNFVCQDTLSALGDCSHLSLITVIDVLFYLESYEKLLRLGYDALKPGGSLIVSGFEEQNHGFLSKLRKCLGSKEAIGAVVHLDRDLLRHKLLQTGFEVIHEDFFCGPTTLLLQTVVDLFNRGDATAGDRLTQNLSRESRGTWFKGLFCLVMLPFAQLAITVDHFFFPNRGHGFLIKANKPKQP